jgi:catalase
VARELGLPAPEADTDVQDAELCPSVSQIGKNWPVDGRVVGIVVGHGTEAAVVERLVAETNLAGMTPLLVAPVGGSLADGSPVDRTLLTARSIEFDALVVAEALAEAPGARVDRDTKAGAVVPEEAAGLDPRLVLLLQEAYRQSKAIVAVGNAAEVLERSGLPASDFGVATAGVEEAIAGAAALLAVHRAWTRFDSSTS